MTDLSDLHNRGWSDENYSNLRTVLTNRSSELNEIIKHTDSAINELKKLTSKYRSTQLAESKAV